MDGSSHAAGDSVVGSETRTKKNYNRAVSYYTTTGRKHGCPAFPSGSINYRVVYADGRALPLEKKPGKKWKAGVNDNSRWQGT